MRSLIPLFHREWLQHRLAWALVAGIPLGLALLAAVFAQVHVDIDRPPPPEQLPLLLSLVPMVAAPMVMLVIALITSGVLLSGVARRDHGDRSIEFWLSLPIAHHRALGVPVLTHALLVPAAALLVGWLGGQVLALVLVFRVTGLEAFAGLPWGKLVVASVVFIARLMAGLPLALLWVLPMLMLVILLGAWFKRWSWVVLLVGVGLLNAFDRLQLGQRWLLESGAEMLQRAGFSLIGAGGKGLSIRAEDDPSQVLSLMPATALHDFGAALAQLASPLLPIGLLFAAACFALLLRWRQQGAGVGD